MTSGDVFHVWASDSVVEAWSVRRLPFEPDPIMAQFRRALADAILALRVPSSGDLVEAVYGSADRSLCDVENILVYNVGPAVFSQVMRYGVLLERSYLPPAPPVPLDGMTSGVHYHRYGFSAADAGFSHWAAAMPVVRWRSRGISTLQGRNASPTAVWRLIKRSKLEVTGPPLKPTDPFGLRLDISTGHDVRIPTLIKPLLDGVIAAFHSYQGEQLEEVSARIAAVLTEDKATVTGWLTDPEAGVLGERRLVWPWRSGVQWNPADDRCVAIRVRLTESPQSGLSGELLRLNEPGG